MLKKCFKYDFRSVFKIWWIAAVTLIGISVVTGFAVKNLSIHASDPDRVFIFETTMIFIYYFSVVAIGILTSVLLCIRFYSNFFSDEGYLTFTLPVKRNVLFGSKILSGFVFQLMSAAVIVTSVVIIASIVPAGDGVHLNALTEFIADVAEFVRTTPTNELVWYIIYAAELLVIAFLLMLSGTLLLYMLITLGSAVVKKLKVVATIGFLVGANYVISAVLIPTVMAFDLWLRAGLYLFDTTLSQTAGFALGALLFLFVAVVLATVSILFNNVTQGCLERKLNLS